MKSTNYQNTFIAVAEDCPVSQAAIPPLRGSEKSAVNLQFETLRDNPYRYTSDDILFSVYALKNHIPKSNYDSERELFFSKSQACLRCSPLSKRYGWGTHHNAEGKVALYAIDSDDYKKLAQDSALTQVKAMRSKRK